MLFAVNPALIVGRLSVACPLVPKLVPVLATVFKLVLAPVDKLPDKYHLFQH